MKTSKYNSMKLDELRRYVLTHREEVDAFQMYIDRSKSEGQMISLDLTDNQWEEKVKNAIRYSSDAIRWYCYNKEEDSSKVSTIINWWRELDTKNVTKHHITGMEIDRSTGIWEPAQLSPTVEILMIQPNIEIGELTALLKYSDRDGLINEIEAVAMDLDLVKQNLFVWPKTSAEVFIFSTVKVYQGQYLV